MFKRFVDERKRKGEVEKKTERQRQRDRKKLVEKIRDCGGDLNRLVCGNGVGCNPHYVITKEKTR